ncbi:MAG: hypothetical protein MZV64_59945 [Ignavibacteriales bacterium]|nr:hypothetical protein [Ignavibacteriales bacterium]
MCRLHWRARTGNHQPSSGWYAPQARARDRARHPQDHPPCRRHRDNSRRFTA